MPLALAPIAAAGISAGANIVGGMMADNATQEANAAANRRAKQNAQYGRKMDRKNIQLQKDFAQQGIRWKVADAEAAGINPYYALGAATSSYSPISVGSQSYTPTPETGMANAIANSGQDISRAIHATRTTDERVGAMANLQLQNMGLQNELLASQVARLNAPAVGPGLPADGPGVPWADLDNKLPLEKIEGRQPYYTWMGKRWHWEPRTGKATALQDYTGDEGPLSWLAGIPPIAASIYYNARLHYERVRSTAARAPYSTVPRVRYSR